MNLAEDSKPIPAHPPTMSADRHRPDLFDEYKEAWTELTAPEGRFATTTIEVRGVPTRVFGLVPPSLRTVWDLTKGHAERDYIVFEDERLTYADADAIIRCLAHLLRDAYGVAPGDRVGIAMRNYPEWVLSYWATVSIGAVAVGMNAWWTSDELEYALNDSRPRVLVADSERVERVRPILAGLRRDGPLSLLAVRHDGDLPDDAARWDEVVDPSQAPAALPDADIDGDDDACIFYTSGTTGFPKGAQLTHRGCVHNLMNMAFMVSVSALAAEKAGLSSGDGQAALGGLQQNVFMAPTPLFHVTANNCLLHPATISGSRIVFLHKWDAGRALELIEREGVTTFSGVPTMSRELIAHPDWKRRDTSTLAGIGGGGAPVQPDLVEKIDQHLSSGAPSTGYGLTETSGIVTASSGAFYLAKPLSCGRVVPTLEAKVVDEHDEEVAPGERGELCVRGAPVIKGYLNQPEATAEAIRDGWFHTGDVVYIDDDGFVYIVDRIKDMVLRGGENVYCTEVEAAIYALGGVTEVAVFGLPDDRLGEIVGAAIKLDTDVLMTDTELRARLSTKLASYKLPERVWFMDEDLPHNATGKVMKRTLKEVLLSSQ